MIQANHVTILGTHWCSHPPMPIHHGLAIMVMVVVASLLQLVHCGSMGPAGTNANVRILSSHQHYHHSRPTLFTRQSISQQSAHVPPPPLTPSDQVKPDVIHHHTHLPSPLLTIKSASDTPTTHHPWPEDGNGTGALDNEVRNAGLRRGW